ncbi:hypothetical protein TIFTF001_030089 [Ficus carica]|uniref:Uncharacterized protein n=1 Tax=Ficus carica TaxID=3494 RepID=A0AA88DT59_FICCA|nr:hypothetical protein TIFTF001_030089 [Ficus carica]
MKGPGVLRQGARVTVWWGRTKVVMDHGGEGGLRLETGSGCRAMVEWVLELESGLGPRLETSIKNVMKVH